MKALVYTGEQQLQMQELSTPEGEFLVKVEGCAICGTDLKTYLHGHPYFQPPTILGHEFYGVVAKAPADSKYKVGDAVVVAPYGECGECSLCKKGAGELCKNKRYVETGSFCEYIAVPLNFVEDGVLPLATPDDAFALVEPLSCVLCGLEKMPKVSNALIIGGGPMGTLFALTLMDRGIPVTVVEPNPHRRDCLAKWDIPVFDVGSVSYKDFDAIVVAVNKPALVEEAVLGISDCGTVLMFAGMPSGTTVQIDNKAIHYRSVTLTGCSGFALSHFREAYNIIRHNPNHYRRLITHRFPLEEGTKAFATLKEGNAFKVLLKP